MGFNDTCGDFALGGAWVEGVETGVDIAIEGHGGASREDHTGNYGEEAC